jgi:preprotein translocase subunit SecF
MSLKFRELIQPGSNFEFVGKSRLWFTISALVILASIAMLPINSLTRGSMLNWSIDFKGGTEIIMTFPEKQVATGDVRAALKDSGHPNVDINTYEFTDEANKKQQAYLVRLPEFGAVPEAKKREIRDAFFDKYAGPDKTGVKTASWSGDNFTARTAKPVTEEEFKQFFAGFGLEAKPLDAEHARQCRTSEVGIEEYVCQIPLKGLESNVERALEEKLATAVDIKQVEGVGAKAGEELRNGAIMALLYAIALILLYIAFRFDFRYGPGTVAALVHDAVVVIGVFAVTWTEFSLTTVAAVLTVIGFSMNDTVVVFDRIRENEHRLKDKKFDRVINISINETLSRTLLTGVSVFMATLTMNFVSTGLVKNFAFAMNVGIIVGTYSSIFIAAPILLWLHEKYFAKRVTAARKGTTQPVEG